MRIAYIAHYPGPTVVQRRPIIRNLSIGARVKIERIAELLRRSSHYVEILSQGEVVEHQFKLYPGFSEPEPLNGNIPVHYSSAFPVRYLNGLWSSLSTLRLFKRRHRAAPFNLVWIYNLKPPQVACANYAIRRLGLPVVLEYEDDAFSSVWGNNGMTFTSNYFSSAAKRLLGSVSACVAASPYLLSKTPDGIPKFLLRGIVSDAIVKLCAGKTERKNWVVFSGTHDPTQGLEQLVKAWQMIQLQGWELHIAGKGQITGVLEELARNDRSIVFHGFLNQQKNAELLCCAKIGMNPQDSTQISGITFAFKIIEYLAAGLHVITTPRGLLEPELEAGVTYMADNRPDSIAAALRKVIHDKKLETNAASAAVQAFGPDAISQALNRLVEQVTMRDVRRTARVSASCEPAARKL